MRNKRAYIWGLITRLGPSLIQLISNMILARFLSPSDFGTIGVLSIIFLVANTLIDSGLGGSLVKEQNITKQDCSTIGVFNLGISLLFYIILFFTAPLIGSFYRIEDLDLVVRLLSLSFVIGSLGMVPKAILIRDLRFNVICIITIVSNLLAAVLAIVMAINGLGVYSLVAFNLVGISLATICQIIVSKYSISFHFSKDSFKRLFSFGIFTTIASVIDTIYENLLTAVVGKFVNVSEAGYLSQAKRLEEAATVSVTATIANVSFPILTKLKNNIETFRQEANSLMYIVISLITPLLFFLILFSEKIITIVYGSNWAPAAYYFSILIWAGILLVIESVLRSFIKSLCEVKSLAVVTCIKRIIGILIIIVSFFISPNYIIYGYVLSCFVGLCFNFYLYTKISSTKVTEIIMIITKSVAIPIVYYIIAFSCDYIFSNIFIKLCINIILLFIVYSNVYKKIKIQRI